MILRRILSVSRKQAIPRLNPRNGLSHLLRPTIPHLSIQAQTHSPPQSAFYSTGSNAAPASPPEEPSHLSDAERQIFTKLMTELAPTNLEVQDISGGCGSMFAIDVASAKFKGMGMVQQHRLVNKILKAEIGGWHGLQLKTRQA